MIGAPETPSGSVVEIVRFLVQTCTLDFDQNGIQHICAEVMTAALGNVSCRLRVKANHYLVCFSRRMFVVQKHAATRLHWDLRLEWGGVLLSWAVTRGPSADPSTKRLAVRTEDHPLAYTTFEGVIPKPEYGTGRVMLWDRGSWAPLGDVEIGLTEGMLKFILLGERVRGLWMLVRMAPCPGEKRENWLLIKERDPQVDTDPEGLVTRYLTSIATGRTMDDIAVDTKCRSRAKGQVLSKAGLKAPPFQPF